MAKLLAYADCSIQVLTNGDPRLCDCNRIVDTDAIPVAPDQPNKEKEIMLKADWKYVGEAAYKFSNASTLVQKPITPNRFLFVPEQSPQAVFHPPQG